MAIYPRSIYVITHNITGRSYVGSSGRVQTRLRLHFAALRSGRHSVKDMQDDFNKYGENYTVRIVDEMHDISESKREYDLIRELNSHIRGIGYNYKDNHAGLRKEEK